MADVLGVIGAIGFFVACWALVVGLERVG